MVTIKKLGVGKWKTTVLSCGTHMNYKGALSSGYDQELFIKLPYLAYLLQDGNMNILIDNGINERYIKDGKAWGGIPAWASSKDLLDSLAKHNLKPEDIDLILYTHLHNDHAGNANLFPTTRSIVQKDEWENLLNPTYAHKLDNLIYFIDKNGYQLDGPTDDILAHGDLAKKAESFGLYTQEIDGHDVQAIYDAIQNAYAKKGVPSCIVLDTCKGKGATFAEPKHDHSSQPNEEQWAEAIAASEKALEAVKNA